MENKSNDQKHKPTFIEVAHEISLVSDFWKMIEQDNVAEVTSVSSGQPLNY